MIAETVLGALEHMKKQLLEGKAKAEQRIDEINKDLMDCDIAISALTPIKEEKLVENMDRMLDRLTPEELTEAHARFDEQMESPIYTEQPTSKLPYRIKTREEMLASGANEWSGGVVICMDGCNYGWGRRMDVFQNRPLKTNEIQYIGGYTIEPWMITENN